MYIIELSAPMIYTLFFIPEYQFHKVFFTARCYASAVLAMALCMSVRPS